MKVVAIASAALLLGMLAYVGYLAVGANSKCREAGGIWVQSQCVQPVQPR